MAARQQQSMMRRGDQQRVEDDAGSLFGAKEMDDLFGDISSPTARAEVDERIAELRASLRDGEDFPIEPGNDKSPTIGDVLDEADEELAAVMRINLCGRGSN